MEEGRKEGWKVLRIGGLKQADAWPEETFDGGFKEQALAGGG